MPMKRMLDPVSRKQVNSDSPYRAGWQGQTFYFENEKDKTEFQARPGFYARKAGEQKSGGSQKSEESW